MKINFNTILLVVAIALIIFFSKCGSGGSSSSNRDTLINTIVLKYDSSKTQILQPVVSNNYKIIVPASEIPKIIDSAQVVAAYYEKHVDIDVRRDNDIEATIQDTIFQNRRIGRMFSYKILRPSVTQQTTIIDKTARTRFYLGAFLGNEINHIPIGLSADLIAGKAENKFGLDYDFTKKFPDGCRIRVEKLISFRKK